MKPLVLDIKDFRQTMQPNLYKLGLARIEHFDTMTGQARQRKYMGVTDATIGAVSAITADLPFKFTLGPSGLPYLLCKTTDNGTGPFIAKWETSGYTWTGTSAPGSFGASVTPLGFIYYPAVSLFLIPLTNGNLASMNSAGTYNGTYKTLSGGATTYGADPLIHSKDGNLYIPCDNVIYLLTSGAAISAALTLPTGFRITSIAEQEDYINIVGYQTDTGQATCYVWDRDSSLTTTTAKYDLFYDLPIANFCPGGVPIVVCVRGLVNYSPFTEKPVLVVKTPDGDRMASLYEYRLESLGGQGASAIGAKFVTEDKLFFSRLAKLPGDSAAKNVVFEVDPKGRVQIALNMGINSGTNDTTGLLKQGDVFYVAAGSDGGWNTKTDYDTTAAIETTWLRFDDSRTNLNFRGGIIECEPLPSGATITVKARKNEETSFTTLATFTTENTVKFDLDEMTAKNALSGLDRAKRVQFRIEAVSTNITTEVAITGIQLTLDPVADQSHK